MSPYLNRPLRTLRQVRAEQFALGVKYAQLRAAGKSVDGILRRAAKSAGQQSLDRIVAKYA